MTGRIDVHQHVMPPFYTEWLAAHGITGVGGPALPTWSAEAALSSMDLIGTTTAILSVSAPGAAPAENTADAEAIARAVNDAGAELVKDRPDRFGLFATLTLPDVASATREAVRALDDLGADGVVLLANSRGTYLGEAEQEELFAELNTRDAVAFVHPAELPGPPARGVPPFAADFLLDTTRAAYLLARNGILTRYPRIRFILSHAGGFLPYASHRIASAIAVDTQRTPLDALDDLRRFYFDTALSSSAAALPSLLAFAAPDHVLFGSDWPWAPQPAVQYFADALDSYLPTGELQSINHDNARALLPRLTRGRPAC